jgi:hypothetical protein
MDKEEARKQIIYYKRQLQAEWIIRNRHPDYNNQWEEHESNCFKFIRDIEDLMDSIGEYEEGWEKALYSSI